MKFVGVDLHKHVIRLCGIRTARAHPKKLRVIAESTRKTDKTVPIDASATHQGTGRKRQG